MFFHQGRRTAHFETVMRMLFISPRREGRIMEERIRSTWRALTFCRHPAEELIWVENFLKKIERCPRRKMQERELQRRKKGPRPLDRVQKSSCCVTRVCMSEGMERLSLRRADRTFPSRGNYFRRESSAIARSRRVLLLVLLVNSFRKAAAIRLRWELLLRELLQGLSIRLEGSRKVVVTSKAGEVPERIILARQEYCRRRSRILWRQCVLGGPVESNSSATTSIGGVLFDVGGLISFQTLRRTEE